VKGGNPAEAAHQKHSKEPSAAELEEAQHASDQRGLLAHATAAKPQPGSPRSLLSPAPSSSLDTSVAGSSRGAASADSLDSSWEFEAGREADAPCCTPAWATGDASTAAKADPAWDLARRVPALLHQMQRLLQPLDAGLVLPAPEPCPASAAWAVLPGRRAAVHDSLELELRDALPRPAFKR
jgi:hypothetical protein